MQTQPSNASNNALSSEINISLDGECAYCVSTADLYGTPDKIEPSIPFYPAHIPGVVGTHSCNTGEAANFDAFDYWYKIEFSVADFQAKKDTLQFDGLLTICEVFLNGTRILTSQNAFRTYQVDVSGLLNPENVLFLCFRALKPRYQGRHPRPKYMTRFVNERNLRFFRTPVIGYTPGFSSNQKLIGPYRSIHLVRQQIYQILTRFVSTCLASENIGHLSLKFSAQLFSLVANSATIALLDQKNHREIFKLTTPATTDNNGIIEIAIDNMQVHGISPYWPHTHGEPKRYQLSITLHAEENIHIHLGMYGFRKVECIYQPTLSPHYNFAPIYLRGACWTPINPTTLGCDERTLKEMLQLLCNAGVNMLRIPGNMPYESDTFYELCDSLGILIYQDYAFTNFDYPEQDAAFVEEVKQEALDFLTKHGGKACLTALSGGSEVYQQACMMGLKLSEIDNQIFSQVLAEASQALAPHVPYFISSPYAQNHLPIHAGDGPCNYHGVGGYRRSFDDARLFKGRWIIECLPFSHIPEDQSLRKLWNGSMPELHSATWKDAVPRDPGSGWDFADITDFYLQSLFALDPVKLRSVDQERYIKFSRATLVEVVETTLSIFRANAENGRAALVWNLHDFKAGAGWGYIDILGNPKSSFYALARSSKPTTALFVDEGLDGLAAYLVHDGDTALDCQLKISFYTEEGRVLEENQAMHTLQARSTQRLSVDYFLGRFIDSSYAYKFGPRQFIACQLALYTKDGALIEQKTYAQPEVTHIISSHIELTALAKKLSALEYEICINTNQPAFYVTLDIDDFLPDDNYFHLMPSVTKRVVIKTKFPDSKPYGRVSALNSKNAFLLKMISSD